ncbi:hypothetical protein [Aurantiacibacter marinus]|uniref:Uncharacterized protein n=1 Tax=Aurantiacibacter marinus TaxID=874156 RepID=A0A0H0XLV9_9SPHN|nr:hypothetical protein [Aurantiacibacter marinus]KLI63588.1 hypothetical protein AAV99_07455 [Aurantiacibacter marinus]
MGKFITFIAFAIGGFWLTSSLFGEPGGGSGPTSGGLNEERMRGQCVRQVDQIAPSTAVAESICGCMTAEFDRRGIFVLDAYGDRFDEMQAITRDCAATYGVVAGG